MFPFKAPNVKNFTMMAQIISGRLKLPSVVVQLNHRKAALTTPQPATPMRPPAALT